MIFRIFALAMFPALAFGATAYGPELQGFDYPYPVARFEFSSQREQMHMAYMDVRPQQDNGRTAVLLHGKNYCAATWRTTIQTLVAAGCLSRRTRLGRSCHGHTLSRRSPQRSKKRVPPSW